MKLSQQCCSMEQAKRLKELGIVQNVGNYQWSEYKGLPPLFFDFDGRHIGGGTGYEPLKTSDWIGCYTAFSVAELRVALREYAERVTNHSVGSDNSYLTLERGLDDAFFYATRTEAESLATLLIWLLENNKITPSEVNQRLQ